MLRIFRNAEIDSRNKQNNIITLLRKLWMIKTAGFENILPAAAHYMLISQICVFV